MMNATCLGMGPCLHISIKSARACFSFLRNGFPNHPSIKADTYAKDWEMNDMREVSAIPSHKGLGKSHVM